MAKHETLPPGALPLSFFAEKREYGNYLYATLQGYAKSGRLEAYFFNKHWYTTPKNIKKYLESRNFTKMPKKYSDKVPKEHKRRKR